MPGRHASFARDHEYKRHGTLSLLAGIDLLTGKVHALVRERHRSREFIEFLKLLDAAYPASTAIKLILDNHSAHISRETRAWLDTGRQAARPPGFFSKFSRSVLRHIRVTQTRTQVTASWLPSMTLIDTQSSAWSTGSKTLPDMIRTLETVVMVFWVRPPNQTGYRQVRDLR